MSVPISGDDGGGYKSLMDEINAIFAPPGRNTGARKAELHPYYKRPGKGHNHDSCDACAEGGDLICCDSCPASFHLSCHTPPLEDEDIPFGDWECLRCFHKAHQRSTTIASNIVVNRPTEPEVSDGDTSTKSGKGRPVRTGSKNGGKTDKGKKPQVKQRYKEKYERYLIAKPMTESPFDALIAAAQVVNAETFDLPREMNPNENFPFSWKWAEERQDDLDTKNCFVCQKGSRRCPSIACDFCPNLYHLDCLDPPLCDVPKDRWMCPNHVEGFIDSNILDSTSLTARLKLWKKYARGPVDPDTVRMEFFRKVRSGKLYQKATVRRAPVDRRIRVPKCVKDQYSQRAAAPPASEFFPKRDNGSVEEWLQQLVALQTSVLKDITTELKTDFKAEKEQPPQEPTKQERAASPTPSESTASNCSLEDHELSSDLHELLNEYLAKHRLPDNIHASVKEYLAIQKLREIFPKASEDIESEVQARAALMPLNVSREPALMRGRTVRIGRGAGNDIDLSQFGHCNFVSAKHASIFFDQYSRVYELLNYSEHGTIVDSVVYALEVRPVVEHKGAHARKQPVQMSAASASESCLCKTSVAALAEGQEGTAVMHHGSYVRMGCLEFVFSIMDYSGGVEREEEEEVKEEMKVEEEES